MAKTTSRRDGKAKAGKRHGPYQAPPAPSTRLAIAKRTADWVEANKDKARTDDIKEAVVSAVDGQPEIRLDFIPGFPRWDLDRAQRLTFHTAKGNRSI